MGAMIIEKINRKNQNPRRGDIRSEIYYCERDARSYTCFCRVNNPSNVFMQFGLPAIADQIRSAFHGNVTPSGLINLIYCNTIIISAVRAFLLVFEISH